MRAVNYLWATVLFLLDTCINHGGNVACDSSKELRGDILSECSYWSISGGICLIDVLTIWGNKSSPPPSRLGDSWLEVGQRDGKKRSFSLSSVFAAKVSTGR